jgi:hypothetical protein
MTVLPQEECTEPRGLEAMGARFFVYSLSGIVRILSATLFLLLALAGCEKTDEGTIDPHGTPPFAAFARTDPDSVLMKNLPQHNGLIDVTVTARVYIHDEDGAADIRSVTATVVPAAGGDPIAQSDMHDDGISPDSVAGDGIYAAALSFSVDKSATGRFHVTFLASDALGMESNRLDIPLYMIRNNTPPVLSNLVAPDTVTVPVGGTAIFAMSVQVTDADGQSDISSVYFRNLDSSDPTARFILRDDGGSLSGDAVNGDGIYTITVQASDSPTVRKTNRLLFQAVDVYGDTSATLLHLLTIR